MQALFIDSNVDRLNRTMIAWMDAGLQVTGSGSVEVAETCLLRMPVDVLVIDKHSIGDALGDTIGMAEELNPHIVSILQSETLNDDLDTLPEHFDSIHAVVGPDVNPQFSAQLGKHWLQMPQEHETAPEVDVAVRRAETQELAVRIDEIHRSLMRANPDNDIAAEAEPWLSRLRDFNDRQRSVEVPLRH